MLAAPPWVRTKKTHGFTRKTRTTTKLHRKHSRSWGQTCHKKKDTPYLHLGVGGFWNFRTRVSRCHYSVLKPEAWLGLWIRQFSGGAIHGKYDILSRLIPSFLCQKKSGVQPKLLKSLRIFIGQGGHESKIHQTQWGWSTCRIVHARRLSTWRNKQGIDVFIDIFTHGET